MVLERLRNRLLQAKVSLLCPSHDVSPFHPLPLLILALLGWQAQTGGVSLGRAAETIRAQSEAVL